MSQPPEPIRHPLRLLCSPSPGTSRLPALTASRALVAPLILGAALSLSSSACTNTLESSTSYTGSASSQSIPLTGYTLEPSGWIYPQVLTSLGVGARDAGATWASLGAFRATSTPTRSGDTDYYAWSGTLTNFTTATWPSGGVARVRLMYEVDGALNLGFTFDDVSCLFEDPSKTFQERAFACASHDNAHLHLVDEDPIRSSSRDYLSLRETPRVIFQGNVVDDPAVDYYAAVDPQSTRTTLAAWKTVNGFAANGSALPGYEPAVSTTYFNKGDLELGRHMNCVKKSSTAAMACYVTNYGDPAQVLPGPGDSASASLTAAVARNPAGLVATVAMEYRPASANHRVTFFAYDPAGARVTRVVLDGEGAKNMPGACLSCHGGRFQSATSSVAGAHFLPFDVDNFSYSGAAGFTLAAQQDAFRALNKLILGAGPTTAITELVNGWYDSNLGSAGPDQDTDFVPQGWDGQEVVYQELVKPYCRGCHVTLDEPAAPPQIFDLNTYDELNAFRFVALDRICERYDMPHAEVTRKLFWQSPARGHLIGEFNLPTACN
jgi:hypothetical protein